MQDDELDQNVEEPDVEDDDTIFDQDTEAPDAKPGPRDWEAEARKARKEAQSLRSRLRRTEIEAKYGADVADLIPDSMPMREWDDFAEKLADRLAGSQTTSDPVDVVASNPEPTPEEQRLAAAAGTSGYSTSAAERPSAKEILELGRVSPGAATREIQTLYRDR